MAREDRPLLSALEDAAARLSAVLERPVPPLSPREEGVVRQVGKGIAVVEGLPGVQAEELLRFPGEKLGMAFNLDPDHVGVVMLDHADGLEAGNVVRRTGRVADTLVGESLLGRVIDPAGRPLDGRGPIPAAKRLPIERPAPAIMDRAAVRTPLQTGIKVVDALIPVGRGQRELILGDRQTGKTAIALDTILNQRDSGVRCIYCAIGQQSSAVARVIEDLRTRGAMEYCTVLVTTGDDPPGVQFTAPYAATTIGEHFMSQGHDVLVVYDDLTRHARAYRELSLLLRRPPGREAFPGDVFYIHSRLLERSTHLRPELGGGSLTSLPICETQAQNMAAYIPTNLIGITDGQIYLSPQLFRQGVLPAVDVGQSVSRVGGKTQRRAYRSVAGDLKLTYAQFVELERFSRYGARLEKEKQRLLERGRRVREVFKQAPYSPLPPGEQVAVLVAVTGGALDPVPVARMAEAETAVRDAARGTAGDILARIEDGQALDEAGRQSLLAIAEQAVASLREEAHAHD